MPTSISQLQTVADGHGFIETLVLSYAGTSPWTYYLCNDTRDWTIGGQVYTALPFVINLPNRNGTESPRASITIDNVGRSLMAAIEALTYDAELVATIAIRSRLTPAVVDYSFLAPLSGISCSQTTISAVIGVDASMQQPAVFRRFDPTYAPGVFAG
jgi:hypothetical protein